MVTCSRHVNDVAVSVTPSNATTEPSTIVGLRNLARSGTTRVGLAAARYRSGVSTYLVVNRASTPAISSTIAPSRKLTRGRPVKDSQKISSGQCQRYSEYAIAPSDTNGAVASNRLAAGSPPAGLGSSGPLAADERNGMVAPTGTRAHRPANSLTPSSSARHESIRS